MDVETVIQSEVSQKNKYCILTHKCGIQKKGTDEPICKEEIEKQMQRTNKWAQGELGDCDCHIYTIDTMYEIDN